MRVYLPATVPLLQDWLVTGSATPRGHAFAVTPSLREWYREGDAEELEHAAALLAAVASLDLIAADPTAPARRVVIAADVADGDGVPDLEKRGALTLRGAVAASRWASALIDDVAAEPVVAAAVDLLRFPATTAGDLDFALGEAEAAELGWYAVQELPFLLD